jgi:hypothetical protein
MQRRGKVFQEKGTEYRKYLRKKRFGISFKNKKPVRLTLRSKP